MRRLIRPSLFALARLGLFFAIANTGVSQWTTWHLSLTWTNGVYLDVYSFRSSVSISVGEGFFDHYELDFQRPSFYADFAPQNFSSPVPGVGWFGLNPYGAYHFHHAWFVVVSLLMYACVALTYRRQDRATKVDRVEQ